MGFLAWANCVGFFDRPAVARLQLSSKKSAVWLLVVLLVFTGNSNVVCNDTSVIVNVTSTSFTSLVFGSSTTRESSDITTGVTGHVSSTSSDVTPATIVDQDLHHTVKSKSFDIAQTTTYTTLTTAPLYTNQYNKASPERKASTSILKEHIETSSKSTITRTSSGHSQTTTTTTSVSQSDHLSTPGKESSPVKDGHINYLTQATASIASLTTKPHTNQSQTTRSLSDRASVSIKESPQNTRTTSSFESLATKPDINQIQATSTGLPDPSSKNSSGLKGQDHYTKTSLHKLTQTNTPYESTGRQTNKTTIANERTIKPSLSNTVAHNFTQASSTSISTVLNTSINTGHQVSENLGLHSTTRNLVPKKKVNKTLETESGKIYLSESSILSSPVTKSSLMRTDSYNQYVNTSTSRTLRASSGQKFSNLSMSTVSVASNDSTQHMLLKSTHQHSTETLSTIPHKIQTNVTQQLSVTDQHRSISTVFNNLTVNHSKSLTDSTERQSTSNVANNSKKTVFKEYTSLSHIANEKTSLFSQTFRGKLAVSGTILNSNKSVMSSILSKATHESQSSAQFALISTNSGKISEALIETSLVSTTLKITTTSHFIVSQFTQSTLGNLNATDSSRIFNKTFQTGRKSSLASTLDIINTPSLRSTIEVVTNQLQSLKTSTVHKTGSTSVASSEAIASQFSHVEISTTIQKLATSLSNAIINFLSSSNSKLEVTEQSVGDTSTLERKAPVIFSSTIVNTKTLLHNSNSASYNETTKNQQSLTSIPKFTEQISTQGASSQFLTTRTRFSSENVTKSTQGDSTSVDNQVKTSLISQVTQSSIKPSKTTTILTLSELQDTVTSKLTADSYPLTSGSHRTVTNSKESNSQSLSLASHIDQSLLKTTEPASRLLTTHTNSWEASTETLIGISKSETASSSQVNVSGSSVQASTVQHVSTWFAGVSESTSTGSRPGLVTSDKFFASTNISSKVLSRTSLKTANSTTVGGSVLESTTSHLNADSTFGTNSIPQHGKSQTTDLPSPTLAKLNSTSSRTTFPKTSSIQNKHSEQTLHASDTSKTMLTQSSPILTPLKSHLLTTTVSTNAVEPTSISYVTGSTSLDSVPRSSIGSSIHQSPTISQKSTTATEPRLSSTNLAPSNTTLASNTPPTSSSLFPGSSPANLTSYRYGPSEFVSTFQIAPSFTSNTNTSESHNLPSSSMEPMQSSVSKSVRPVATQLCYSTTGQRCVCYRGQQVVKGNTEVRSCSELLTEPERRAVVVMAIDNLTPSRKLENKTKQVLARLVTKACNNGSYNCLPQNTTQVFTTGHRSLLNSHSSDLTTIVDTLINTQSTILDSATENRTMAHSSLLQASLTFLQSTINPSLMTQTTNASQINPAKTSTTEIMSVKFKRKRRKRSLPTTKQSSTIRVRASDVTVVEMRPAGGTTLARLAFLVKYTTVNRSGNTTRLLNADTLKSIILNNTEYLERELNVTLREVGLWENDITNTIRSSPTRTQSSYNPVSTSLNDKSAVQASNDDYKVMIVAIIVGVSCVLLLLIIIAIVLARMNSKWQGEFVPNNNPDGTISPDHNTQEMIASAVDPAPRITDVPFKSAKTKKNNKLQLNHSNFNTSEI